MARTVYTRRRRYNYRKRKIIAYSTLAAMILALVILIFLLVCGCIFVWNTFFKKDVATAGDTVSTIETIQVKEPETMEQPEDNHIGSDGNEAWGQESEPTGELSGAYTVVLDAGHGGNDSGTFSGDIVEKDITLAVTKKMQKLLEEQGVIVVMTREKDKYLALEERTEISNEEDTDLFVSIHCNAYEKDSSIKGIECYYPEDDDESRQYAEVIMDGIEEIKGIVNRGAKEEDYYVTEFNDAPAVLVEMGFLSNPGECAKLIDSDYQQQLAEKLVDGIMLGLEEFTEEQKTPVR